MKTAKILFAILLAMVLLCGAGVIQASAIVEDSFSYGEPCVGHCSWCGCWLYRRPGCGCSCHRPGSFLYDELLRQAQQEALRDRLLADASSLQPIQEPAPLVVNTRVVAAAVLTPAPVAVAVAPASALTLLR